MAFACCGCPAVDNASILVIDGNDRAVDLFSAGCRLVDVEDDLLVNECISIACLVIDQVIAADTDASILLNRKFDLVDVAVARRCPVLHEGIGPACFELVAKVMAFACRGCPAFYYISILVIDRDDRAFHLFSTGCRLVDVEDDLLVNEGIGIACLVIDQVIAADADASVLLDRKFDLVDVAVACRCPVLHEGIGPACFKLLTKVMAFACCGCPAVYYISILVIDRDDRAFYFFSAGQCLVDVKVELPVFYQKDLASAFSYDLRVSGHDRSVCTDGKLDLRRDRIAFRRHGLAQHIDNLVLIRADSQSGNDMRNRVQLNIQFCSGCPGIHNGSCSISVAVS